jgi:uncharacterized RDD family membrane protein YckC
MNAGFFKRAFSSLLDASIMILVLYLSFILGGRTILRNQVENFDEVFAAYNQVVDEYNASLNTLYEEYTAAIELAGDDETLVAAAQTTYDEGKAALDAQQLVDIEPYDASLTPYFLNCIFYFVLGFIILLTIYTVLLKGMTLGRRLMQLKLEGAVNPITIFFHDIIFKYFFVLILSLTWSPYAGLLLAGLSLIVDVILINFSRKRQTLRDMLVKISVVKTGYGY